MTPQPARDKEIRLSLPRPRAVLGEPLVVEVAYVNRSNAPMSFRDPARTWEVMLSITDSRGEAQRAPFGRIFRQAAGGVSRNVVEDASEIELEPGSEHKFTVDAWNRWPALFHPGRFQLQVIDRSSDVQTFLSNTVELAIAVARESVPLLLKLAADEKAPAEARQAAVEGLARLRPALRIQTDDPTPAQVRKNAAALREFETWWAENKDSEAVAETMARINGAD